MSDLIKRLRASVRMDAINGDAMERGVCGKQMLEAADALERLRKDAERYRWLRDLPEGHPSNWISEAPGDMWDAAIDAAMRSGDIR